MDGVKTLVLVTSSINRFDLGFAEKPKGASSLLLGNPAACTGWSGLQNSPLHSCITHDSSQSQRSKPATDFDPSYLAIRWNFIQCKVDLGREIAGEGEHLPTWIERRRGPIHGREDWGKLRMGGGRRGKGRGIRASG